MRKIFILCLLATLIIGFSSCEEENDEQKEIVPENGTWRWESTGTYADVVWFTVNNGKISNPNGQSIGYTMEFDDGWSTSWSCMGCVISIKNGSFEYEDGELSDGKLTITGKFTSSTTCTGKVTYQDRDYNGYFIYNATIINNSN